MAAPTKNSAPIITLSLTLTVRAGKINPVMAPGQSQQTAPATAKTLAKTLICIVPLLPLLAERGEGHSVISGPDIFKARAIKNL